MAQAEFVTGGSGSPARLPGAIEETFLNDIPLSPVNAEILSRWERLSLPDDWLVAGCRSGVPPAAGTGTGQAPS